MTMCVGNRSGTFEAFWAKPLFKNPSPHHNLSTDTSRKRNVGTRARKHLFTHPHTRHRATTTSTMTTTQTYTKRRFGPPPAEHRHKTLPLCNGHRIHYTIGRRAAQTIRPVCTTASEAAVALASPPAPSVCKRAKTVTQRIFTSREIIRVIKHTYAVNQQMSANDGVCDDDVWMRARVQIRQQLDVGGTASWLLSGVDCFGGNRVRDSCDNAAAATTAVTSYYNTAAQCEEGGRTTTATTIWSCTTRAIRVM